MFGKEATAFTRNLLLGELVYLRFDGDRTEKYGRLLAYLYRAPDGLFVNLEVVRQGYGRVYFHATRDTWAIVNIATIGLAAVSIFALKSER